MSARELARIAAVVAAVFIPRSVVAKPDARASNRSRPGATQRATPKKATPKTPARAAPRPLEARDAEVVKNLQLLKELELLEVLDFLIKVRK